MGVPLDFERLEVFKVAVEVAAVLDEMAAQLPDGRGYMRDQLRRAANSIPLNIAEGAGEFAPVERPSAPARSSFAAASASSTHRAPKPRSTCCGG